MKYVTHAAFLIGALVCFGLTDRAEAQVLPPSPPVNVHLVTVKHEARLVGARFHWVYQGTPGQRFCVAFATSNRTALSSNGTLIGRPDLPTDGFPCSTFNADGRGEVSVSVYDGTQGLLFATLWMDQDHFHTDVYRLGGRAKRAPALP